MHLLKYFDKLSLKPENSKELKGLILDLAIRGRLTEEWRKENASVESASGLFDSIQEEKKKLIKDKKIKKEKTWIEIKKSNIPFELPSSWKWCRLGAIIHNFGQKKPDQKFSYIEVGSIDNIKGNIKNDFSVLNSSEAPSRARKLVKNGCVIYSTVRPYLLNIAIVKGEWEYEPIASTAFAILNPLKGCPPEYLYSYLRSNTFIEYVESQMKGVAYPAINDKKLMNGLIPLPPVSEQKAIVQIVSQLMQEVDQLELQTKTRVHLRQDFIESSLRQLTTANGAEEWKKLQPYFTSFFDTTESIDKLKEAILQLAVQGKLTKQWRERNPDVEPASVLLEHIKEEKARLIKEKKIKKEKVLPEISEDEIPFELPEGWVWCRMGELFTIKSSKRIFKSDYQKEGVPFYRSKEIGQLGRGEDVTSELYISREKYETIKKSFGIPLSGDVLIACIGGSIGNTWLSDDREYYYKDGNLVQINNSKYIESYYLLKYLDSSYFYETALGKVSGSAYNALTIEKIKRSLFPLPPENEQREIISMIDKLIKSSNKLKQKINEQNQLSDNFLKSSTKEVIEKSAHLQHTAVLVPAGDREL